MITIMDGRVRKSMKRTLFWGILFVCILFLASCGTYVTKGDKPSVEWSRSILLGENVIGSIGLWVEESDEIKVGDLVSYVCWLPWDINSDLMTRPLRYGDDANDSFYFSSETNQWTMLEDLKEEEEFRKNSPTEWQKFIRGYD